MDKRERGKERHKEKEKEGERKSMWSIKEGGRREVEREKGKRQREARTETGKETALEQILLFLEGKYHLFQGVMCSLVTMGQMAGHKHTLFLTLDTQRP